MNVRSLPTGLAVIAVCALALIPFYVVLLFSLSGPAAFTGDGINLIPSFRFSNYVEAWTSSNIGGAIMNSVVITVIAVVVLVTLASAAGYAIARFPNPMNRGILILFLTCMMIPGIINTVPLYRVMRAIGGINQRWSMSLLLAANALPFSVFLYTGFIKAIPRDVEEAGIMDGCSRTSVFFRITFHFLKPVTAAVIILNGLTIWNNYAQAVFFLQRADVRTIPLAVSLFFQQYGADWNLMAAAAVIGVLPAVAAFLVFQKYFVTGIVAGALKG